MPSHKYKEYVWLYNIPLKEKEREREEEETLIPSDKIQIWTAEI